MGICPEATGNQLDALKRPDLLAEEYTRRIEQSGAVDTVEYERKQITLAMGRLRTQEDRITEAYVNEAMDLEEALRLLLPG